jgi:hypothetical protein
VSLRTGENEAAVAGAEGRYRIQSLGRYGIGTVELTASGGHLTREWAGGQHRVGVCRYNPETRSIDMRIDSRHLAPDLLPLGHSEIVAFSMPWARLVHSIALELAGAPFIVCVRRAGPFPAEDRAARDPRLHAAVAPA